MTENADQFTDANQIPASAAVPPELTAGTLLRRAREAAGLHIAALAVSLKVPVKKLEALEADRPDLLSDAVFVRALAASVCRALKVDPTQILQRLPNRVTPSQGQRIDSRRPPVDATIPNQPQGFSGTISRQTVIGGLLLVVGALLLVFLPPFDFFASQIEVLDADSVSTSLPVMAVEPIAPDTPAVLPVATALEKIPATVHAAASVVGRVVPTVDNVQTVTSPTAGILVFRATVESWVAVTDAKGLVLLRRELLAGEVASVTGMLPLSVIVGRADATQVQIRGQAFDLTPVTRDNVARFEVK